MGHLIDWRSQIDAELTRRNMVRTRGPVTGELMERVVADAYQAPLTEPATKSVDMIHPDGRTIQVKTRTLAGDRGRRFAFTTIDADLTVVIMLDPVTNTIQWAREIPAAELRPLLTPHEKEWRLPPGRAQLAGTDITQRLRTAHEALQAQ